MAKTRFFPKFKKGLVDVTGKVFVITGTTSGTGYVAARTAAEFGGTVLLLNRKSKRVDDMIRNLTQDVPGGIFEIVECDLQNFESVRKAIQTIQSKYDKIYALVNNAGIMATPDEATVDGYDKQMQTNHLSHFLLTAELFPLLQAEAKANGDARIVNHSSLGRDHTPNGGLEEKYFGRNGGTGKLGDNRLKMMAGGPFERYFQTKLANSVFTYALHDKIRNSSNGRQTGTRNIRAVCAHPGGSDTNLADHLQFGFVMNSLMRLVTFMGMMQSPEDGAMGIIKGMMHPDAQSGVLYGPKNSGTKGKAVINKPKNYENNPASMSMLWRTSEAATGVTFSM